MNKEQLIAQAVSIAKKFIKPQEGLCLVGYPDPASVLSKTLSNMGKLNLYKMGKFELTKDLLKLDPEPVTIGYGETGGIKLGTVWSLEQAEEALSKQVTTRALDVLKSAPNLLKHSPEKLAACISLQFNIGATAFKNSTVAKKIAQEDMQGAAQAFKLWNQAQGKVMQGLINRRQAEVDLFLSVKG